MPHIYMITAHYNGNFDGKLVENLADGSVGRWGDLRSGQIRIPPRIFLPKLMAIYFKLLKGCAIINILPF